MPDVEINSFELKYSAFIYLHIFGVVHINIDTYTIEFRNTLIWQLVGILYTLYIQRTTDNSAMLLWHELNVRVQQYCDIYSYIKFESTFLLILLFLIFNYLNLFLK